LAPCAAERTKFKDLGLIVVMKSRNSWRQRRNPKRCARTWTVLLLTATPIPRTLQFSLMGARDLSIINTPPPNRQPIQTEVQVFDANFIREAIYFETERSGQIFFIHNRVHGLAEMTALIKDLCPDLNITFAHGQMEGHELEERIMDFIDKKFDILVYKYC
jgi:transcription-repair coupling factor (superfamily II helicase)